MSVICMGKLKIVTVMADLGYPIDDESVRNDAVVIDVFIENKSMQQSGFERSS